MTTLSQLQEDVGTVRTKLSVGEDQLASLRSQIGNKQGQLSQALRQGTAGAGRRQTFASARSSNCKASLAQSQKNLDTVKQQLAGLFQAVGEQPWDLVQQLSDSLPFLLLPVRLEARFHDDRQSPRATRAHLSG